MTARFAQQHHSYVDATVMYGSAHGSTQEIILYGLSGQFGLIVMCPPTSLTLQLQRTLFETARSSLYYILVLIMSLYYMFKLTGFVHFAF